LSPDEETTGNGGFSYNKLDYVWQRKRTWERKRARFWCTIIVAEIGKRSWIRRWESTRPPRYNKTFSLP